MTDEQIIAAAGEPVAHVVKDDEGEQLMYPAAIFKYKMASEEDIICDLYTADAILAAAKPLRDRIAELEASASTIKEYYEQVFDDGGKRIAELTKQRDGAMADAERWRFIELHWSAADIRNNKDGSFNSMTITFKSEQLSDQINREKLCRGFDSAIAAPKTGCAA